MNDRERILTSIIDGLVSMQILRCRLSNSAEFGDSTHVAPWDAPKPGDLVYASTTRNPNEWSIAVYVRDCGNANHVVRNLVSGQECDYINEQFYPIRNVSHITLLYGKQREFYMKVRRACDDYLHRFGDIRFEGSTAVVTIREAFGISGGKPYEIVLPYGPRVSIKRIREALHAGGYGTREWETV